LNNLATFISGLPFFKRAVFINTSKCYLHLTFIEKDNLGNDDFPQSKGTSITTSFPKAF